MGSQRGWFDVGVKAAMLVFGDYRAAVAGGARPDSAAAAAVVRALRPDCAVEPVERAEWDTLDEMVGASDKHAYVAVLPEATIVCDWELVPAPPSVLPAHVREFAAGREITVLGLRSSSDLVTFARWSGDGTLIRSYYEELGEVAEDLGEPFGFEVTEGHSEHLVRGLFGFVLEGRRRPEDSDPGEIRLDVFRVTYPDQEQRDAALAAAVARMIAADRD